MLSHWAVAFQGGLQMKNTLVSWLGLILGLFSTIALLFDLGDHPEFLKRDKRAQALEERIEVIEKVECQPLAPPAYNEIVGYVEANSANWSDGIVSVCEGVRSLFPGGYVKCSFENEREVYAQWDFIFTVVMARDYHVPGLDFCDVEVVLDVAGRVLGTSVKILHPDEARDRVDPIPANTTGG